MSDPVTNVAIEDVLSSIRRLVSEDARVVRPQAVPAEEAEPSDDTPSGAAPFAGKLVLTPALRVAEEADERAGDDADGYEDDPVQDLLDDVTAAVSEGEGGAEPLALRQDDLADVVPDDLAVDEPAPEQAPEWQADSVEETPEALAWVDHAEDAAEDALEAMPEDDAAAWADVEDDLDAQAGTFTRAEEAQPFVFASSRDGAESRRAGAESYRDEADLFGEEEAILDEEALREMVADIVRQELQGALGERITRNVRKLVRREIHRALTSHEFD